VFLASFLSSFFVSEEERGGKKRERDELRRCLEVKMSELKKKKVELREWEEGLKGLEREENGEALPEGFLVRLLQLMGRAVRRG
jgi:hypothetical protein